MPPSRSIASILFLTVISLFTTFEARGQAGSADISEAQIYAKKMRAIELTEPLKSDLFGEQLSLYNGTAEFFVTDLDVPGNSPLPVRVGRRLATSYSAETERFGGFGDWEIDAPVIHGVFGAGNSFKWNAGTTLGRCSDPNWHPRAAPIHETMQAWEAGRNVWTGNFLRLPGTLDSEILALRGNLLPQGNYPSDGRQYKWSTRDDTFIACIPTMSNGYPGEGFLVRDKSGRTYHFDVGFERTIPRLSMGDAGAYARVKVFIAASKVEDHLGNWVAYDYQTDKLIRIRSSDGRQIDLTWLQGRVSSAATNGRTVTYSYASVPNYAESGPVILSTVQLPDSSKWEYSRSGTPQPQIPFSYFNSECGRDSNLQPLGYVLTQKSPSGVTGIFNFSYKYTFVSGVRLMCYPMVLPDPMTGVCDLFNPYCGFYTNTDPNFSFSYALTSKQIAGPGFAPQTWAYDYPQIDYGYSSVPGSTCSNCTTSKTVTVNEPNGEIVKHKFGVLFYVNNGKLLEVSTENSQGTVISRTEHEYLSPTAMTSLGFPPSYGYSLLGSSDPYITYRSVERRRRIVQDGMLFTRENNSFDQFARPTNITSTSMPNP